MFFDDYVKYVGRIIDAPTEFIESSNFHILSSILSRYLILPGISMQTRPNIMILLSSIPGRTRRSTLTDIDRKVYYEAYKHIVNAKDKNELDQFQTIQGGSNNEASIGSAANNMA